MFLEKDIIKNFKPGVKMIVHLFAAAFLWTVVGSFLIVRGWGWLDPFHNVWFVPAALFLGTLKSLLVLDKTARKGVERISHLRDGTCLGAVYSWKTWILVAIMILSGVLLRNFFEPGKYIGTLYCAIGWALILSSRYCWIEWVKRINSND